MKRREYIIRLFSFVYIHICVNVNLDIYIYINVGNARKSNIWNGGSSIWFVERVVTVCVRASVLPVGLSALVAHGISATTHARCCGHHQQRRLRFAAVTGPRSYVCRRRAERRAAINACVCHPLARRTLLIRAALAHSIGHAQCDRIWPLPRHMGPIIEWRAHDNQLRWQDAPPFITLNNHHSSGMFNLFEFNKKKDTLDDYAWLDDPHKIKLRRLSKITATNPNSWHPRQTGAALPTTVWTIIIYTYHNFF